MQRFSLILGLKERCAPGRRPPPLPPQPQRAEETPDFCSSIAIRLQNKRTELIPGNANPRRFSPGPRAGGKKGHAGQRFSYIRIKHQMLSTSREQVKRRGNTDESREKIRWGSSGEVGVRAGRGRARVRGGPRSTEGWKRGRETGRGGGKCKRGKAGALKENRARTPRSLSAAPGFQTRIPKEAGVGGGDGTHHS